MMDTACVVGLGYIGLPTAALLASRGIRVRGVDTDPRVVETVRQGRVHIVEADLEGLVAKVVSTGALEVSTEPGPADAFLITVPTPLGPDRQPVLAHVHAATRSIAPHLAKGSVVILESTSPVGTTREVARILAGLRPDLAFPTGEEPRANGGGRRAAGRSPDVAIAYCPERVLPGRILSELVANDRVVGGLTPACARAAARLYARFVRGEVHMTRADTAELVKLSENAFRDVNVAFANELSMVADRLGVDGWEVIRLANRHPRVDILKPGPGVGGHCIAVDPWFIVASAPEEARLIRTAREVNDGKAHYVHGLVTKAMHARPDAHAVLFGLAFKANVDDLRESPALEIAERLARDLPGRVSVVEPFVDRLPRGFDGTGAELIGFEEGLARGDVLALLVDHGEFAGVTAEDLAGRAIVDARGLWRRAAAGLD